MWESFHGDEGLRRAPNQSYWRRHLEDSLTASYRPLKIRYGYDGRVQPQQLEAQLSW